MRDLLKLINNIDAYCNEENGAKRRAAKAIISQFKKDVTATYVNPFDKARWKLKLNFEKELVRMRRL